MPSLNHIGMGSLQVRPPGLGAKQAWAYLFCLLTLLPFRAAQAEVRRAVIIGINKYSINPSTDRTSDLEGAVNDAIAMAETLRTYHGFQAKDIHLILDQDATRARILKELKEHLSDRAQPGDISLFYFAGHGSYQDSPTSLELDHRDETIVPADTNRGAPDILDKELARLFNRVLDRKAQLVGIFDSCHSGSIMRGYPGEVKTRFAPALAASRVESGQGAEPAGRLLPEERGALILAAAQEQQQAQERYIKGQPRGRFTNALQQILNTEDAAEPVDNVLLRLRALMQAGGSAQEPAVAATKQRRGLTLWGVSTATRGLRSRPLVAVGRVTAEVVYLQAGFAIGLGREATLLSTGSSVPTQLKITEILGPTRSKAIVEKGDLGSVTPGDLFAIERYGAPYLEPLRVFVPAAPPPRQAVEAMVKLLAPLRSTGQVVWVKDPTEVTPSHTVFWQAGQWVLRDPKRHDSSLGVRPSLKQLLRGLHIQAEPPVRLFLSLPLPAEQVSALSAPDSQGRRVEGTPTAAHADYLLIGRAATRQLEYAWVLPGVDKESRPGIPARSEWEELDGAGFADNLTEHALRLARLKTWQALETPADVHHFPYRLQLQSLRTQEYLDLGTKVHSGETYRPVLIATGEVKNVKPRYVYLFALNGNGGSTLLIPGPDMAVGENLLPDSRDLGSPRVLIPLGHGMRVTPPFGTDTLILLTSATALPDPSVLEFKPLSRGVQTRGACTHPLECLIFGIRREQTRGAVTAPVDWSIERLIIQSEP